jgi:serine/threonine protein kinase
LDFKERRWRNVSESAKKLLRGLLNVDPKKRMKLKDLQRHEWVKTAAGTSSSNGNGVIEPKLKLATPKVLNKTLISYQNSKRVLESGIESQIAAEQNGDDQSQQQAWVI